MNFIQISLTTKCNYGCWHCPITKWRNNTHEREPLTNEKLIPWINTKINQQNWIIELTGGEPSLYEGIDELLEWLATNGYKTIVKTNGTGNLKHYDNVRLIAAFHRLEEPPKNYDEYLIIDKVDSEKKIEYCKKNKIPYKVIGYNQENPDNAEHGFCFCAFLNPAGHQVGCQALTTRERIKCGIDLNQFYNRPLDIREICKNCKAGIDCWKFIPESWKN